MSVIPGSALGLAVVPAILFIAFDLRRPLPNENEVKLDITRSMPEKVLMREPVVMELTVFNRGKPLDRVILRDNLPTHTEVALGSQTLLCKVRRNATIRMKYQLKFDEPGIYLFKACTIRLQSMFGLAERSQELPCPFTVRVYPKHLTERVEGRPARAFGWSGITSSKFKGGRQEFVDIREYKFGDPLKEVNWKASGKLGKTLVNERIIERGLDCIVIVDLSSEAIPRVREWSGRADVITAAYELASGLISTGNRVGMLILGDTLRKIRPGFGSRYLNSMVEGLVDSKEGMVWSIDFTERFLEMFFRRQYRARGGTLFFVFAKPSFRFLETLTSLSGKGFSCNSVMVDVLSEEKRALVQKGMISDGNAILGMKFARAELEYSALILSSASSVFVWREREGFKQASRRIVR